MALAATNGGGPRGRWSVWWYFTRVADENPDATIFVQENGSEVSYSELRAMAQQLDQRLRHAGVGPGDTVMLVSDVCVWAMAALLAVQRVGAVFVPNDPSVPPAKRAEFLKMAGVQVALCQSAVLDLPSGVTPLLSTAPAPAEALASPLQPAAAYRKDELAAIFFSSGSTGVPKGVQHSATLWFELIGAHVYDPAVLTESETIANGLRPVSWSDGFWHGAVTWYSSWGCFHDVMQGLPVVIVTKSTLLDAQKLRGLRELQHARGQPRRMYFPPAHLRTILATEPRVLDDLELVYVWGEKMDEAMVTETGRQYPQMHLLDWLGTSETFLGIHRRFKASEGIVTAHWQADPDTTVYIVEPGDHTKRINRLDTHGEMVFCRPDYATMSIGYLDSMDVWRRKFVPNPFGEGVLYRTGDIAQWRSAGATAFGADKLTGPTPSIESVAEAVLPSGQSCCCAVDSDGEPRIALLEVLGRNDDQIKVRGQMVNLVEIDTTTTALPFVSAAGSRAIKDGNGDTQIVLYTVLEDDTRLADVRTELNNVLESFAVPMFIEAIDKLPYNANGKLVRRELPQPNIKQSAASASLADNRAPNVDEQLLSILRSKLGPQITLKSNFFKAGGHSLLAVELVSLIHQTEHLGVKLSVGDIFANAEIQALASLIKKRRNKGLSNATDEAIPPRGGYAAIPVPAVAPRVSCMIRGPVALQAYQTVSMGVWLSGDLNKPALRRALATVLQRHEALRSHFCVDERGRRFYVVTPAAEFPLPLREIDLTTLSADEAEVKTNKLYEYDACFETFDIYAELPFDEVKRAAPLVRFHLVQNPAIDGQLDRYFFFYAAHHQVFDGWSDTIFWKDFNACYLAYSQGNEADIGPPPLSYLDFALWSCESQAQSEEHASGMRTASQIVLGGSYGSAPIPDCPNPRCEAVVRNAIYYRGGPWTEASIPFSVMESLRTTAQSHGTTLFQAVIAVWHMWQYEMTELLDIGLGVTMLGRDLPQLQNVIGNFQHVSCVRTRLHGCSTFLDVLERVKDSFAQMKSLSDCVSFDHATWADVFEGRNPERLPPEAVSYFAARPKVCLNFEEVDYGNFSTSGFMAAGLNAVNQISPVSSSDYLVANKRQMETQVSVPGGPLISTHTSADGIETITTVVHEDGTKIVISSDGSSTTTIVTETSGKTVKVDTKNLCCRDVTTDSRGAVEPYYYPTVTDGRIDADMPNGGNFGPRCTPQMNALRDIDDWEMYFAVGLSSRTAEDKDAYKEDYIYLAFDDQLYSPSAARAALDRLVAILQSVATKPSAPWLRAPQSSKAEVGPPTMRPASQNFVDAALIRWQKHLATAAAEFRAQQELASREQDAQK